MPSGYRPFGTRPLSQVEIEQRLTADLDALEEATTVYRDLAEKAALSEVEFKKAFASAYLRQSGSIKDREHSATYLSADQMETFKIDEALLKSQREVLTTIRNRIDACRTLNANVREQV